MSYQDQATLDLALNKLVEAFCLMTDVPVADAWELVEQIAKDRT